MSYKSLCSEFYDLTKPTPTPKEWHFYNNLVKQYAGPCLEAMCGSGRLLLPLLEQGYEVDGVDNATNMLKLCKTKCSVRFPKLNLFEQNLENLELPYKYKLIFISIGSFQHIKKIDEAVISLRKLHDHLSPNGTLVIETFAKENLIPDNPKSPLAFKWRCNSKKGYEIINKSIAQFIEPNLILNQMQYEKWENGHLQKTEKNAWHIRAYEEKEMKQMLSEAGFNSITIAHKSFEYNPHAIIYFANQQSKYI